MRWAQLAAVISAQRNQAEPCQHGQAGADHLLDLTMDLHPADDVMQGGWDHEAFDDHSDRRRHHEMRGALHERLPRH